MIKINRNAEEKRYFLYFLLFVASVLFFIVVMPENHSEAEDAFNYARIIEKESGSILYHPHHLLYLPMQKAIYIGLKKAGYVGRAYPVAQSVSIISGAIALLFFFAIVRRISKTKNDGLAFLATAGLLFSYGFMRYACEVEIYLPAMAAGLGAIYCSFKRVEKGPCGGSAIFWSLLALLLHITTATLVLICVPLIYWFVQKNKGQALRHIILVLLGVGLSYHFAIKKHGLATPNAAVTNEGGIHLATLEKSSIGLGQTMLSANFIFSQEKVAKRLKQLFPYRVFDEELFMAKAMPKWMKTIAPITFFIALIGLFLTFLFLFFRLGFKSILYHDSMFWISGIWFAGTAFPTLWKEPANPELWVLCIPAIWILFFICIDRADLTIKAIIRLSFVIFFLGIHNIIVGMGMIKDRESDYNFKKAEWILQQAKFGDAVLTTDSFVFTSYLKYWSPAFVYNLNTEPIHFGRHTYLFNDLFSPSSVIKLRNPEFAQQAKIAEKKLRPLSQKIHQDAFGGIWIVENPK